MSKSEDRSNKGSGEKSGTFSRGGYKAGDKPPSKLKPPPDTAHVKIQKRN